jgi:hypothetical protein
LPVRTSYVSCPDGVQFNQELLGLERIKCIGDDILVYGTDEKDHDQNFERERALY